MKQRRGTEDRDWRKWTDELNQEFKGHGISAVANYYETANRWNQKPQSIELRPCEDISAIPIPDWAEARCPYHAKIDGVDFILFAEVRRKSDDKWPAIGVYGPGNEDFRTGIFYLTCAREPRWTGPRALHPLAVRVAVKQWRLLPDVREVIKKWTI